MRYISVLSSVLVTQRGAFALRTCSGGEDPISRAYVRDAVR